MLETDTVGRMANTFKELTVVLSTTLTEQKVIFQNKKLILVWKSWTKVNICVNKTNN